MKKYILEDIKEKVTAPLLGYKTGIRWATKVSVDTVFNRNRHNNNDVI